MAAAQQVANAFTVDFIERVAKNAPTIGELYGHHVTLTMNDFERGIVEQYDGDVPIAVQKWAELLQGSRLRVDSVNAAPIYGGVNVFLTLTAMGEKHEYYHITTTLESFQATYGMDSFYIRHQVIARIGAIIPEPPAAPPAPEPTPAPAAPAAAAAANPEARKKSLTPEPEPVAAEQAQPEESEPTAASAAEPEEKPAAAPVNAKPKSWASLVSHAPTKAPEHKPLRVVAHEGGKKAAPEPAAAAAAVAPAARRPPPRERKAPEAIGDRLMFTTTGSATDEEIRTALGPMAAHLVSLRQNTAKNLVFMDFAEKVNVYDELVKMQPTIGAAKMKMGVYRQRARD